VGAIGARGTCSCGCSQSRWRKLALKCNRASGRCGRIPCYLAEAFFFPLTVVALPYVLGTVALGNNGGGAVVIDALTICGALLNTERFFARCLSSVIVSGLTTRPLY